MKLCVMLYSLHRGWVHCSRRIGARRDYGNPARSRAWPRARRSCGYRAPGCSACRWSAPGAMSFPARWSPENHKRVTCIIKRLHWRKISWKRKKISWVTQASSFSAPWLRANKHRKKPRERTRPKQYACMYIYERTVSGSPPRKLLQSPSDFQIRDEVAIILLVPKELPIGASRYIFRESDSPTEISLLRFFRKVYISNKSTRGWKKKKGINNNIRVESHLSDDGLLAGVAAALLRSVDSLAAHVCLEVAKHRVQLVLSDVRDRLGGRRVALVLRLIVMARARLRYVHPRRRLLGR